MSAEHPIEWNLETVRERCDEIGDCWIWRLSLKDNTQPQARIDGNAGVNVRRWMYDVLLGKKRPVKSIVAVSCQDLRCCAPAHLVWSTRSASASLTYRNGRRDLIKLTESRRASAIKRGLAKIDMGKANEIRLKAGASSTADLALEYGLSTNTVRAIIRNKLWRASAVTSVFNWRGLA